MVNINGLLQLPPHAVVDRGNRGQGVHAQAEIVLAANQVVHNAHLVPTLGEVQGSGPATVAISTWVPQEKASSFSINPTVPFGLNGPHGTAQKEHPPIIMTRVPAPLLEGAIGADGCCSTVAACVRSAWPRLLCCCWILGHACACSGTRRGR